MCLITFAYKSHPDYSLILVANRDEFYQRPSKAMHYWDDRPDILAGRDLQQGGTWLGINTAGKFTTVTNYRDGKATKQNPRSRGDLTRIFLSNDTSAPQYLQKLDAIQDQFGDYNLLVGDSNGLFYHSNRGAEATQLQPGVYGLSNALLDTPWPKLLKVRDALSNAISSEFTAESLCEIMQDPTQATSELLPDTGISNDWEQLLSSCFISSENYGTRATTVLLQKLDGETFLLEQNFTKEGKAGQESFKLKTAPIG